MVLQIRRGTSAAVTSESFVPAIGEPLYVTDEEKLYIGNGTTVKGVSVGDASRLEDLSSVTLVTESIGSIASYQISSNVATVTLELSKGYTQGLVVTIADSPYAILNGTHTITGIPSAIQFTFAVTSADVSSTATTGSVTPIVPDGHALVWDAANSYWKNAAPPVAAVELVNDTTPQLGGNLDLNGNSIVSVGSADINFDPATGQNVVFKGNATDGSGKIVLNCENNSHGIKLKGPPHSAAASYTLTLPNALPLVTGQALTSDLSGNLSFATITGGGGAASRAAANATTLSIVDSASDNITISGAKSYMLQAIETSAAAWVTVYTSTAARTSDASRTINTDPLPGSGVIAEVITGSATTQKITPGLLGFNDESTPTSDIYLKVENQSGSTASITVTLYYLILES